jgi:hypothetical protein
MRRLVLALLICLLPLQSFAGLVMNAQMAGMGSVLSMDAKHAMPAIDSVTAAQAPCHEASQPLATDNPNCCDLQGVCQALCHVVIAPMTLPLIAVAAPVAAISSNFAVVFQSADLRLGFKPPLL